jgi:tRNA G18 (ribose-2'-O)-methylase SpoU
MLLKFQGYRVFALETSDQAKALEDYRFPEEKTALVFGNERFGLEAETLRLCDALLEIPCLGQKNSLNVGVSLGIACYEWRRQRQAGSRENSV